MANRFARHKLAPDTLTEQQDFSTEPTSLFTSALGQFRSIDALREIRGNSRRWDYYSPVRPRWRSITIVFRPSDAP